VVELFPLCPWCGSDSVYTPNVTMTVCVCRCCGLWFVEVSK